MQCTECGSEIAKGFIVSETEQYCLDCVPKEKVLPIIAGYTEQLKEADIIHLFTMLRMIEYDQGLQVLVENEG